MRYDIEEVLGGEDCSVVGHFAAGGVVVVWLIESTGGVLQRREYEQHRYADVKFVYGGFERMSEVREWVRIPGIRGVACLNGVARVHSFQCTFV